MTARAREHSPFPGDIALPRRSVVLGLALATLAPPRLAPAAAVFRLGLTPVFLDNDAQIVEALRSALGGLMRTDIVLEQRRTYQEVTGLLLEGSVDAAWLCGYPYLQHREALGVVGIPVWRGRPLYQSYLIVDAGDPATSLADLRGGTHAFSDPDSNSGYLVTAAALSRLGTRPDAFFGRTFFTYGHRNVVRAVAGGLARSGSVDGYVWEALATIEPGLTGRTRIIEKSAWDAFPPFVAKVDRVESPPLRAFRDALLRLDTTGAGRELLALLQLDAIAAGDPDAFASIAARMESLRQVEE